MEALNREYEELRDKMFSAEEKIEELNAFEDELNERINKKKKELESLNDERLSKSYKEANEVKDKIT